MHANASAITVNILLISHPNNLSWIFVRMETAQFNRIQNRILIKYNIYVYSFKELYIITNSITNTANYVILHTQTMYGVDVGCQTRILPYHFACTLPFSLEYRFFVLLYFQRFIAMAVSRSCFLGGPRSFPDILVLQQEQVPLAA